MTVSCFSKSIIVSPLLLIIKFKSLLYGQEDFYPLSPIHHLRIMMQAGEKKGQRKEKLCGNIMECSNSSMIA